MVRNIVGALHAVGTGALQPRDVAGILAARDRGAAPEMAPAHGLYLTRVSYPVVCARREAHRQWGPSCSPCECECECESAG